VGAARRVAGGARHRRAPRAGAARGQGLRLSTLATPRARPAPAAARAPGRAAAPYAACSLASAAVGIAAVALFTRLLPPAGYGTYAVVAAAAMLGQTALFQWLQTSVLRLVPATAPGGLVALDGAVRRGSRAAAGAAVLVALVVLAALPRREAPTVALGLLVLLARGRVGIAQNWNRALGRPWRYAAVEALNGPGMLLLAVAALRVRPGDVRAVLLAAAGAAAVSALLVPSGPPQAAPDRAAAPARVAELWSYGMPLSLVSLASCVLAASDRLLVAGLLGPAAAGAYAVASVVADRSIGVLLMAVAVATKPMVFAAWERGGAPAAHGLLARVAAWLMALGSPASALLVFAPRPVAGLLAGPGLAPGAAAVLPWVGAGALLSALVALHFGLAFQVARRTPAMVAAIAPAAVLNLAANLVLLPRYGVMAAAWTTLGGYALALAATLLLGRRHFAVPFPWPDAARTLLACVPLAVVARGAPAAGGLAPAAWLAAAGAAYLLAALVLDVAGVRRWTLAALTR